MASKAAVVILRLLTLALLVTSLALIAADKLKDDIDDPPQTFTFKDVHTYRYLLAVSVIGCAYTLLHLPFAIIAGSKPVTGAAALLVVLADVAFALLLATGAAAGLGFTHDVKRYFDDVLFRGADDGSSPEIAGLHRDVDRFFDMAFASSGLMLAAAACTVVMIVMSVHSLAK
ncbi:hypothetical protein HU200_063707 [Digitaria exilis]|uniref:CASP-like protein n=1 Tax=Digitaria exilis TaxID=1010633 RepID=A0A835A135_9POAL|nr:hypothetical protein HU200_063707 [Digitaria exilis]CAB3490001.1 unnamed protein product [Digitaria exilis]